VARVSVKGCRVGRSVGGGEGERKWRWRREGESGRRLREGGVLPD
jgi:hypothetical protein